jgi:hypothetical protein
MRKLQNRVRREGAKNHRVGHKIIQKNRKDFLHEDNEGNEATPFEAKPFCKKDSFPPSFSVLIAPLWLKPVGLARSHQARLFALEIQLRFSDYEASARQPQRPEEHREEKC